MNYVGYPPDLSDIPPVLYKYRNFDEFGWRMLTELEVFFASPRHFNDPLDTRIPVLYEQGTLKQMYKKNYENSEFLPVKMTRKERKRWAMEAARTVYNNRNDPVRREDYRRVTSEKMDQMAGILSLSAVRDHTLMWSHYAGSHRGFCIGFDSHKLIQFMDRKFYEGVFLLLDRVRYYNDFPKLNPYKMTDTEIFMTKLFSKSQDWSYEKEYRIICDDRPDFALELDTSILHSITLGAKCSSDDREEAIRLVRDVGYTVSVEEAKIGETGKLEFVTVCSPSV